MATHKSAAKRARQAIKRTGRNSALLSKLRSTVREFRETLATGDAGKIEAAYNTATREIRRAATRGVIKKETASRNVSRLSLALNKVG